MTKIVAGALTPTLSLCVDRRAAVAARAWGKHQYFVDAFIGGILGGDVHEFGNLCTWLVCVGTPNSHPGR